MEILHGLANALLEVGGRHDLQVFLHRQPGLVHLAVGRLHHQLEEVDAALGAAGDDDLVLPALAVGGEDAPDRLVALLVAAQAFERGRDVLHLVRDAQVLGQHPAAVRAERAGVALGQQQAEDLLRAERMHRQRRAGRAVDAAGHGHDDAAAVQLVGQRVDHPAADAIGLGGQVDLQHIGAQGGLAHGAVLVRVLGFRRRACARRRRRSHRANRGSREPSPRPSPRCHRSPRGGR